MTIFICKIHSMKKSLFVIVLFLSNIVVIGQNKLSYLSYIFPSDSINGFDEDKVKNEALSHGYFGNEFKVYMYRAKRNYINEKYGFTITYNNKKNLPITPSTAPCLNEDFEASPTGSIALISGWTITEGQNSNFGSCTMSLCCSTPATGKNTWIRTTPYNSGSLLGTIPNSPLGGTKIIQLNDNITSQGEVVRLSQTFTVTSSNCFFQYAYMCEEDGRSHTCCSHPYLNVTFYDCSNNIITAGTNTVFPPNTCSQPFDPSWTTPVTSTLTGIYYHKTWQLKTVNLSTYIGSCVKVQVTMGDCDGWAHYGYCFFDAKCGPSSIMVNSTPFLPVGTINACGIPVTLNATGNPTPIVWNGPSGSGINTNTNVSITTSVTGTYTLTTGTGSNTAVNIFTLNVLPLPTVSLTASSNTACTSGGTISLNASPGGGVYYGTGVSGPKFSPPSTAGNYLVSYYYSDPINSCANTATLNITVNVCTAIDGNSLTKSEFKIYPNPNNGEFVIEASNDEVVMITNELGQTIKIFKLNSENNYSTKVSGLAAGIYFVAGNQFREKVVITK